MSIKITIVYFLCKDITLLTKYMIILVERKCIDLKCLYGSLHRWCVASCNCIIYTSSLMAPCNHRCPALRFGDVGSALLGLLKKKWNTRWLAENVLLNIFIHSGSIYIGGSEFLLYEFYSRFRGYEITLKIIVSFPIEFLTSMIEHQFHWLNNISTISIKKKIPMTSLLNRTQICIFDKWHFSIGKEMCVNDQSKSVSSTYLERNN